MLNIDRYCRYNSLFDFSYIDPHNLILNDIRKLFNNLKITFKISHFILHQPNPINSFKKYDHLFDVGSLHEIELPITEILLIFLDHRLLDFIT